jgi:hypothetical protein
MCFKAQSLHLELERAARLVQFVFSVQPMQILILEGRFLFLTRGAGRLCYEAMRLEEKLHRHLLPDACASLLGTRRRRCAVASCGLRAPFCIGAPCVISTSTALLQW